MSEHQPDRRRFLKSAAAGVAAYTLADMGLALAAPGPETSASAANKPLARMPVRQVQTDVLDIGYHEVGPEEGRAVILLHGFPYDIHSYVEVWPPKACGSSCRTCAAMAPHAFWTRTLHAPASRALWARTYWI